jgi:menaquinol-cytochrome c reductase iron-sulfur subunit
MMGAIGATLSVPLVAYLLSPLLDPRRVGWRDLGPLDQFPIGETVQVAFGDPTSLPWAGQTALTSAWVHRDSQTGVTVFAVECTHLGCPVSWRADTQLFVCPCHGGMFAADGSVVFGPPPRPLVRYETRVQDANLQILARGFRLR